LGVGRCAASPAGYYLARPGRATLRTLARGVPGRKSPGQARSSREDNPQMRTRMETHPHVRTRTRSTHPCETWPRRRHRNYKRSWWLACASRCVRAVSLRNCLLWAVVQVCGSCSDLR
jgi:hypothetical protein